MENKKTVRKFYGYLVLVSFLHFSLCVVVLSINIQPAYADIYISEVLYNPFITESGGEAVELYNSGDEAMSLSGYTLATASSIADATFPDSAIIQPGGYYLIADSNWQEKKDFPTYASADHEESITMKNTDSGVALLDESGNVIDAVGWGDKNNIDQILYSIEPSNYSDNGYSLKRTSFTGNNNEDFISAEPELVNSAGLSRDAATGALDLTIHVEDLSSYIQNISLPFDIDNKISIFPGSVKQILLSFQSQENLDDIEVSFNGFSASPERNETHYYYVFSLDFHTSPGNYSFDILALHDGTEINSSVSVEILPVMAFSLDLSEINCYDKSCIIDGDDDIYTTDKPTIRNIGNVPLDFNVYADNLTDGSNSLNTDNILFSFDSSDKNPLHYEPKLYHVDLQPESTLPLFLEIDLPSDTVPGDYSTQIIFMGVSGE
ncbi:lamin tail domain-containing protein [Candidatus Woesearchaeota archaeon]|nr:lamin tail domain-containing protein [Candidatus Woesearchaeota archaeon]